MNNYRVILDTGSVDIEGTDHTFPNPITKELYIYNGDILVGYFKKYDGFTVRKVIPKGSVSWVA